MICKAVLPGELNESNDIVFNVADARRPSRSRGTSLRERDFGCFAAGFTPGDHALCLLESGAFDENDVLLFGYGIEEVASHEAQLTTVCGTNNLLAQLF